MVNENSEMADKTTKKQPQSRRRGKGRPFKKGQSGNPKGRPIGSISFITVIKQKLAEVPRGEKQMVIEALVDKIIKLAQGGSESLLKDLINRIDGIPKQSIAHEGNIDSNQKVTFEKAPEKDQIEDIVKSLKQAGAFDRFKNLIDN